MAVSTTLAPNVATPRFQTISPKPARSYLNLRVNASNPAISTTRKRLCQVGVGLLAASILGSTPLDANATRIQYYATVSDPPCEFNYAPSGLGYCDIAVGSGPEAPFNELINVHYTARFSDGIVFDSSYKRGRSLTMRIGVGKVIKGLDQGIYGGEGVPPMLVGGKRKLQIPPHLAYGPEPAGCFSVIFDYAAQCTPCHGSTGDEAIDQAVSPDEAVRSQL